MRGRLGRLIRWHSQNLNEKNGRCGSMIRAGRAWFYPFPQTDEESERNYKPGKCIGVEWYLPHMRRFTISLERGGYNDYDLMLCFGCGLFALYVHFENFVPKKWQRYWNCYDEKEVSLSYDHGSLRWRFWSNPSEWHATTPKWRDGSLDFVDFFLGRADYRSEELQRPTEVAFVFPDGAYVGVVTLTADTWKRKRWPFTKTVYRAHIEVKDPPKFAGKGENSWDCGDDGIYGMTCQARSFHEAIQAYEKSVYENRARYGTASKVSA